ncbi:hypothetical protein CW304_01420 [Bacillus sp. UFRGS-B20]|nr:hypothetical protein CW304_01420 [Bacillus sp. UFRGS-B20]
MFNRYLNPLSKISIMQSLEQKILNFTSKRKVLRQNSNKFDTPEKLKTTTKINFHLRYNILFH